VLPAFVDTDVGRTATTYERAAKFFADSRQTVARVLMTTPEEHDLWVYLHLAQLRNVRSWRAAVFRFFDEPPDTQTNPGRIELNKTMTALESEFCNLRTRFRANPGLEEFVMQEFKAAGVSVANLPAKCVVRRSDLSAPINQFVNVHSSHVT
jgi:hypothetical protein